MEAWYYTRLPKALKPVYHDIYEGLKKAESAITVPKLDGQTLADIYYQIRMDHPEIFYTVTFHTRAYAHADTLQLCPDYLFEGRQLQQQREAMKARVAKLARAAQDKNEADRLKYIHDFICENVRYDKLKKPYSHEIIGPLGQGVGVCEGIAKSVKVLCDALDIPCVIALCDNNPARRIRYRHMWDVVRVGGKYYHLDATFDNSLGSPEEIRYDYYLLGDSRVFRDHEPVIWPVPACPDNDAFYYKQKKLSFTKIEDVRSRAAQYIKKNKTLIFHWRGGYLTNKVLAELFEVIRQEADALGRDARVAVNRPQAVLHVQPAERLSGGFELQQANEGESEMPLYDEPEEDA